MTKLTITIEKELFDENGVPMVRRSAKENDIVLYDYTKKVVDDVPSKFIHRIEEWACNLRSYIDGSCWIFPDEPINADIKEDIKDKEDC